MDIHRRDSGAKKLSIVCLISRLNEAFFNSLNKLELDSYELILVLDGVSKNEVIDRLNHYPEVIVDMKSEYVNQVNVMQRRTRIANLMQIAAGIVGDTTYALVFEDDTVVSNKAYKKLKSYLEEDKRIGFATGVQMGRWGIPYLGAWKRDGNKLRSVPYLKKGAFPIDACGLYFLLVRTALFKNATFRADDSFGPDVYFTLGITEQGYQGAIDYSVICGHIVNKNILHPHEDCTQVTYSLDGDKWIQQEVPPFRNILGGHG